MAEKELEVNERTIGILQQILLDVLKHINQAGFAYNGKSPNSLQAYCLDMLQRIAFNLEAVHTLSPNLLIHVGHRLPIFLILRPCLTDYANTNYLLHFVNKEKTQFEDFENELKVTNLEFMKMAKKLIDLEAEQNRDASKAVANLKSHTEYFNSNGEFKKANELRTSINPPLTTKSQLFNDTDKLLLVKGKLTGIDPFFLWKFFSQYEHYTQASRWFYTSTMVKKDVEFFNLITAVLCILEHLRVLFECLDMNGDFISKYLKVVARYEEFDTPERT